MRCWPEEADWHGWLRPELAAENHSGAKDGSPYELDFFRNVLKQVQGLDPRHIEVQREVNTRDGFRYPDFVLDIPSHQPIALEVDGRDKSSRPHPDERDRSIQRDAALEAVGYRVQHFTNRQVATDPAWCTLQVERLIEETRQSDLPIPPPISASQHPPPATARRWMPWAVAAASVIAAVVVAVGIANGRGEDSAGSCGEGRPVKGNVTQSGEKIYHEPGWTYYDKTNAEECFATPSDAEDAGYRPSQVR
jgi:very-short-patch-repair endonuclease